MKVRAKLFAQLRELVGREEVELDIEQPTVSAVFDALVAEHPELGEFRHVVSFAVNDEYVPAETVISEDSEVALIPPISGG
jgi:molybdopterin converting factor subunit 1